MSAGPVTAAGRELSGDTLRRAARMRRSVYAVLVLLSTLAGAAMMSDILRANGTTPVEMLILALFTINFAWIASSFWSAVAGFLVRLGGGDPLSLDRVPDEGIALATRTAVLMPVYNEDPQRVFAGLEAIWTSLGETGEQRHFDLFILSDTTRDEIAAVERRAWGDLVRRLDGAGRIFYRRRMRNTGRKAGNIADFCQQWGSLYDHMLVLDADSVMEGRAILRMARLMQATPRAGIIQSLPIPVNRETLFARAIQFASRLYSPMLTAGLSWWQLADGNYWGHNAIIRTRAFIENCGLPILPGKPPLGGEILSHDFVEAALIKRGGWQVWILSEMRGSYEEVPPNIIDYAKRDRRWSQGNLQHLKLLPARGFGMLAKLHLLMGVMAYVSSPLWLFLLCLSTIDIVSQAVTGHAYFLPGYNLYPIWPISKLAETVSLFAVTMGVLVAPKILSLILALPDGPERRGFGGAARLVSGVLLEQLLSMLVAPTMMLFHSSFVFATLLGRGVNWNAQERGDRGLTFHEALRRHGVQVVIGVFWGVLILYFAPDFLWWILPALVGLLCSVGLSMLSSRADLGRAARRAGIFLTPEESRPPPVLRRLFEALARPVPAEPATPDPGAPEVPPPEPVVMEEQVMHYWIRRGRRAAASRAR